GVGDPGEGRVAVRATRRAARRGRHPVLLPADVADDDAGFDAHASLHSRRHRRAPTSGAVARQRRRAVTAGTRWRRRAPRTTLMRITALSPHGERGDLRMTSREVDYRLSLPLGERDHHLGPLDARWSLVEYGDYQCPYCGMAYPATKELVQRLGDGLCFV